MSIAAQKDLSRDGTTTGPVMALTQERNGCDNFGLYLTRSGARAEARPAIIRDEERAKRESSNVPASNRWRSSANSVSCFSKPCPP